MIGAAYWTFAALEQIERLRWQHEYFGAHIGERPQVYDDNSRDPFMRLAADRHFLLVSLANVHRALTMLESEGAVQTSLMAAERKRIRLLRNIVEHWYDDPAETKSTWSLTQFGAAFPGDDPHQHTWSTDGSSSIGGLSIEDVAASIDAVREWVLEVEASSFVWTGELPAS